MGKKPFISLAGLFLAGVAITATGCGQCTSCNTRPGKFNPGSTFGKGPTPAVGDRKPATEVAGDSTTRPAPAPAPADITSTAAPSLPPTGTPLGSLKTDAMPVTPVSAQDRMPGRDPLEGSTVRPTGTTSAAFPVPPTPVRTSFNGQPTGTPTSPMPQPAELPTDTMSLPPGVVPSVPTGSPPVPQPPVTSTPPAPPPLPGGTPLPPLGM